MKPKKVEEPEYYLQEFEHWSSPYRIYKLVKGENGGTWYEPIELYDAAELLTKLLGVKVEVSKS